MLLVSTILLFPLGKVNAIIPGEDAAPIQNTDSMTYYEYDITEQKIKEHTFEYVVEELSENDENQILSTPAYVPNHLANTDSEYSTLAAPGNWTIITNPQSNSQYRSVVFLDITLNDNTHASASGFLIGPSVVATAAHALYNSEYADNGSYYAKSVTVAPAAYENNFPYGTTTASSYLIATDYINGTDTEGDWALILLNSNIGDQTGWLGLQTQTASYNGTSGNLIGYPRQSSYNRVMFRSFGSVTSSSAKTLSSTNMIGDIGMSGGPLSIYNSSNGYVAIGLIRSGTSNAVQFTRITSSIFQFFSQYTSRRV